MLKHTRLIATAVVFILIALIIGFATQPTQAQILGTGWVGKFYNNTNLSGSPVADNVPYPYGLCAAWYDGKPTTGSESEFQPCISGQPLNAVNSDNFSATFDSAQNFSQIGTYIFTLRYNDGIRLVIDGQTVFEDFVPTVPDTTGECANRCRESTIYHDLTAGTHNLKVDYVDFSGEALIQVQWGYHGNLPVTPVMTPMTATPVAPNELMSNSGFEGEFVGDAVGSLSQWKVKNGQGDKVKCNRPNRIVSLTGDCAFQFKGSVDENSKLEQTIDVVSSAFANTKGLNFNTWVFPKNANVNAKAIITVKYSDNTDKTKRSLTIPPIKAYLPLSNQIPFASSLLDKIKVQFSNKSPNGKLYIDEVSLQIVEEIVPTPTPAAMMLTPGRSSAGLVPLPLP